MSDQRRAARGFTLVEVMIVTAIIGILASVAIPSFQRYIYRAKRSERPLIMQQIKHVIDDYYLVHGSLAPPGAPGFGFSFVWADFNPAWPPQAIGRPMKEDAPGWNVYFTAGNRGSVSSSIEGRLHYSYQFYTLEMANWALIYLAAVGDLDGDGAPSGLIRQYQRVGGAAGVYRLTEYPRDLTFPPTEGLEMNYSSYQIGDYF